MISLALYFLAAFGLAYVVGHSAISMPVRLLIGGPEGQPRAFLGFLVALLECPACFGTWTGLVAGAFLPGLFQQSTWWAGALVAACATAGLNFIIGKATGLMPGEPDPMREQLAAMIMAQMQQSEAAGMLGETISEHDRRTAELRAAGIYSRKMRPDADGILQLDPEAVEPLIRVLDETGRELRESRQRAATPTARVLIEMTDLRDVLSPLQYFASGDAHENEVRADSLEALTVFDAKYPGVLVAEEEEEDGPPTDLDLWPATIESWLLSQPSLTFVRVHDVLTDGLGFGSQKWTHGDNARVRVILRDLGWKIEKRKVFEGEPPCTVFVRPTHTHDFVSDAEIARVTELKRNPPDDTPANWAKYRANIEAAEAAWTKHQEQRTSSYSNEEYGTPEWEAAYEKRRAADDSMMEMMHTANASRPKDPMTQTHALTDAPGEDDITPEDIAAFQCATDGLNGKPMYPSAPEQQDEDAARWAEKNEREESRRTELGTDSPAIHAALSTTDDEEF